MFPLAYQLTSFWFTNFPLQFVGFRYKEEEKHLTYQRIHYEHATLFIYIRRIWKEKKKSTKHL